MLMPELEPCSPDAIQGSSYFQVAFSAFEALIKFISGWMNTFKKRKQLKIDHL